MDTMLSSGELIERGAVAGSAEVVLASIPIGVYWIWFRALT